MAKQKIVVKVAMSDEKKARKALKIAVSLEGVESVSFVGSDRDQIAVTGEGIDSVELTTLLRKGVGHTELISIGPASVEEARRRWRNAVSLIKNHRRRFRQVKVIVALL